MFALLRFFLALFSSLFKSKSRLEAENAALRRQLIVLQRKVRGRVHFTNSDRLFLIQLYRWFPSSSRSSSRSLSQASPSTWSSDMDRPASPGAPSCATTHRTSRPWICSLLRPLALICSMALSLFDWPAGAWSGLPSLQIPLPSGLLARSARHSLGTRLHAI